MRKESLEFLKQLVTTASPSGFEENVQKVCRAYVEPYVDKVYKDVHGNQYAVRNPDAALRVMLAGHVDEIGLMVNNVDDKGFIAFVAIGGVDPAVLAGQRVTIHGAKGSVQGVIGRTAIHLTDQEDRGKALKMHQMWIDIGAKNKKDAEKVIAIGDPVTTDAGFISLRDDKVVARGFDDRIGAFVIIEAMRLLEKRKIDCAVYCVTTVAEEIGLRGAITSSYGCHPHAGIAVDVGHATDYPSADVKRHGEGKIHGGPMIARGPNINPIVHRQLIGIAKSKKIPYQVAAEPRGTGTDANAIQLSRGGVAAALVSIPNRYMHSPVELISLQDAENTARLIAEWIASLKSTINFIP
ncbi:MAG: M42 family metallopeptidase [Candidatus Hydrogenedentes bacterium]|nr:M42 family metallopeptidase [Candidatus Hydrogenedentota bacterium]